jgi:hypothetical protein
MMNAESAEFQAFVPNNVENPAKKRKKTEIPWTEQREFVLVSCFNARKAHIRTKGLNLSDKELQVFSDIQKHSSFADIDPKLLTIGAITMKFSRLMKQVSIKYALEVEGANLSALPENPCRIESLLHKMIEERLKGTSNKNDKKQKEIDRTKNRKKLQQASGITLQHEHNPIV